MNTMNRTVTYQPISMQIEGWSNIEAIQELLIKNDTGFLISTGLGYATDRDENDLPLYYAVHIPARQQLLRKPLPTQHLMEKFLEGLLSVERHEESQAEEAVCWDQSYDALVARYTLAKLKQIIASALEETNSLIGWANAENTLRALLVQHGPYLQGSMDREFYGRLIETLDRIACKRQGN